MKRFLLLGILLFTYVFGHSQVINKPDRSAIVCLGTNISVIFTIDETSGPFSANCKFQVQLSDKDGSFNTYTTFSNELDYVSGKITYSGSFLVDGVDESVLYKVRVKSTSPEVLSSESEPFRVIKNDDVHIKANGPTEFCTGQLVTLMTADDVDTRSFDWYKVAAPNNKFLGTAKTWNVVETGEYYALSTGSCIAESVEHINVVVTDVPTSGILEADKDICTPDSFTFHAETNDPSLDHPYFEWLDINDNIVETGETFTTNVSGVYRLRTTNYGNISAGGGCPTISNAVELKVHDFVSEIVEQGPIEICTGNQVTLTSVETNPDYIYEWYRDNNHLPVSGKGVTSISFVSHVDSTGLYKLKVVSPVCEKTSTTLSISIKETPQPTIEGDLKGCDGTAITLKSSVSDVNNEYKYQWFKEGNPITGANSQTFSLVIGALSAGDYYYEMTYGTCVTRSPSVTVLLVPKPVSIILEGAEVIVCDGDEATLNANSDLVGSNPANVVYYWLDAADVVVATGKEFKTITPGEYRLKTANEDVCSDISAITTVVVSPIAESKIKNTILHDCTTVALESESDLKGGDPARVVYKWYKDDVLVQEGITPTYNAYSSGDYKLETLNYGLCGNVTPVYTIAINDLNPEIDEDADVVVCSDAEYTLNAMTTEPTYQYIWYREKVGSGVKETLQDSNDFTYIIKGEKADVGEWNYTLRVVSPECDKESSVVKVSISMAPDAIISPDTDQVVCEFLEMESQMVETPDLQLTYQWYKDGSPIANATLKSYKAYIPGKYFFKIYNKGICEATSKEIKVSLSEFEHEIAEGDNVKECVSPGSYLTLTSINKDDSFTYVWKRILSDGSTIDVGNGKTLDIERLKSSSGVYFLEVSDAICTKASNTINIEIEPVPISEVLLGSGLNCESSIVALSSKVKDASYTYNWYFNEVEIVESENYKNVNSSTLYVTMFKETEGEYKVKVSIGSCDGAKSQGVILAMDDIEPQIDYDPNDLLCKGGSVKLSVTTTANVSKYSWTRDGVIINGATKSEYYATLPGKYISIVKSENSGCLQFSDEVVVESAPDMGVVETTIEVEQGEIARFEAFGGDNYRWLDSEGNELQNGGSIFEVEASGNATYQLEISNSYCSDIIDLFVVSGEITSDDIQNIITPNGDGFNDTWVLPSGFVESGDQITILNRQGSVVYKSSDYNNDWRGTLNDGPALPAATYYYVIKRKDKEPVMGSITIFR